MLYVKLKLMPDWLCLLQVSWCWHNSSIVSLKNTQVSATNLNKYYFQVALRPDKDCLHDIPIPSVKLLVPSLGDLTLATPAPAHSPSLVTCIACDCCKEDLILEPSSKHALTDDSSFKPPDSFRLNFHSSKTCSFTALHISINNTIMFKQNFILIFLIVYKTSIFR